MLNGDPDPGVSPSGLPRLTANRVTSLGSGRGRRATLQTRATASRAATPHPAATDVLRVPPDIGGPPAPGAPPWTKPGLPRAAAKALALSNRSAGSFSSALASAAATFDGTVFRCVVTSAAGSAMIFMMICCADPPRCGGWPASIS